MTETLENNEIGKNADKNNYEPETKTVRYDGMIKDIVWHLDNENIIALVNELYGCELSFDSEVIFLETETQNEENERNSDFHLRIGDRFFHMEVQSNEDGSMAFRIFEYGFRTALMFGREKEDYDTVRLRIPEPAVIFLRKGKRKYHKKFTIILELPGEDNIAQYECKAIYVNDFSLETIFEKRLFPLVPFFFMRYEEMLKRKHTDEEEHEMLEQLRKTGELLNKAVADKTISYEMAKYIKEYVLKIFGHTVEAKNVNNEEVNKAMKELNETVTIVDWFAIKEKAIAEGEIRGKIIGESIGETRGKIQGKIQGITSVLKKIGHSKEEAVMMVVNETGLSEDEAEKCVEEIWNE